MNHPHAAISVADPVDAAGGLQFIQVAFAGHNRAGDLGDPAAAGAGLAHAFAMLAAAGVREARLLTGLAPGADRLAAEAWRASGLGPIHAVFPFLDDPDARRAGDLAGSATLLDGKATQALGRNAYLAQTRWLIGAADLLVVVWTGRHAKGAGGTADAVRLALEHGVPVLWVSPGAPSLVRLISPEHLDEGFGFLEFLEEVQHGRGPLVRPATAADLHEALGALGLSERPGAGHGPTAQARRKRLLATPSRTYAWFRRVLGGKPEPFEPTPPPADLAAQPGFASLTEAYGTADEEAQRLGGMHRSHQVILLGVAILAAIAGSAASMWSSLKLPMMAIELILALGALVVWRDSERERRHERWGGARKLAEDLRLERAAWALGVSTVAHGVHGVHGADSVAAHQARRLAGLPHGAFDRERTERWGEWMAAELLAGQAHYHHDQATINTHIAHRVHQVENASFVVLMVSLVAYVAVGGALMAMGQKPPQWFSGLVEMAGAIVPAIGAACLALDASLSLGEQAQRSRLLSMRLRALAAKIGPAPRLEDLQAIARAAIRLQRVQEDHWAEDAARRRLIRGS